jgi:hypothetical protein
VNPQQNQDDEVNSAYSYGGFIDNMKIPIREMDSEMEDENYHSDDETH